MKAGWKNRIEERRYFEEKRAMWRELCMARQLAEMGYPDFCVERAAR